MIQRLHLCTDVTRIFCGAPLDPPRPWGEKIKSLVLPSFFGGTVKAKSGLVNGPEPRFQHQLDQDFCLSSSSGQQLIRIVVLVFGT